MTKPTMFDLVSDRLIFHAQHCPYCDSLLDLDNSPGVALTAYQGQFGHVIIYGYHTNCLRERMKTFLLLGAMTIDNAA
jgi:hypothetical protein